MDSRRTLGDHIDATRVRVVGPGGPDRTNPWADRLKSIVVDGRKLGDHDLHDDKEPNKRINELLGIGYALVGADVDGEIAELHSVDPRREKGKATADFIATLNTGRTVRIELCSLVDERELQYVNVLQTMMRRTNERLAATSGVIELLGTHAPIYVRFYGAVPTPKTIEPVAQELVALILSEGSKLPYTRSMRRVGPEYPALHALDTCWTRDRSDELTHVEIHPNVLLLGRPQPKDAFRPMFEQKAAKFAAYSDDGGPVWLAMYIRSPLTIAYGDVEAIAEREVDFDPHPFERVVVGSLTIGVTFERGQPPKRT